MMGVEEGRLFGFVGFSSFCNAVDCVRERVSSVKVESSAISHFFHVA